MGRLSCILLSDKSTIICVLSSFVQLPSSMWVKQMVREHTKVVKEQPAEEHRVTTCANIIVKGRWQHGGTVVTLKQQGWRCSSILCRVWMFFLCLHERSPGPPVSYNCPTACPFGCLMTPDSRLVDGWMSEDLKKEKCSISRVIKMQTGIVYIPRILHQ